MRGRSGWWWATLIFGVLLLVAGRPLGLGMLAVWLVWTYKTGVKLPVKVAGCAFGKELIQAAGGHASGPTTRRIAIHEAGHVAAKPPGTRITQVVAARGYGFVKLNKWGKNPVDNIAFLLAGQMAEGSQAGASYDNSVIKQWLRTIPEPERKDAYKKAQGQARAAISGFSGLSGNAKTIYETGTL